MPGRYFYRYSVRVRSESTGQGVHSIGVAVSLSVYRLEKVNNAGGEPFIRPDFLGKLVRACADLGLKVTIISNGSLIRRKWMEEHERCDDLIV